MADYDKSLPGLYRERNTSFGCPLKLRLASARDREQQFDFSSYINVYRHPHKPSRAFMACFMRFEIINLDWFVCVSVHPPSIFPRQKAKGGYRLL